MIYTKIVSFDLNVAIEKEKWENVLHGFMCLKDKGMEEKVAFLRRSGLAMAGVQIKKMLETRPGDLRELLQSVFPSMSPPKDSSGLPTEEEIDRIKEEILAMVREASVVSCMDYIPLLFRGELGGSIKENIIKLAQDSPVYGILPEAERNEKMALDWLVKYELIKKIVSESPKWSPAESVHVSSQTALIGLTINGSIITVSAEGSDLKREITYHRIKERRESSPQKPLGEAMAGRGDLLYNQISIGDRVDTSFIISSNLVLLAEAEDVSEAEVSEIGQRSVDVSMCNLWR